MLRYKMDDYDERDKSVAYDNQQGELRRKMMLTSASLSASMLSAMNLQYHIQTKHPRSTIIISGLASITSFATYLLSIR